MVSYRFPIRFKFVALGVFLVSHMCYIYYSSRFPIGLLSFFYRIALGVLYMFSTCLLYDSSRFPLRVLCVAYMVALRFFSVSPMYFYTIPLGFLYASYRFSNGLL